MESLNFMCRFWHHHALKFAWTLTALCFLAVISTIMWDVKSGHRIKLKNYSPQTIELIQNTGQSNYRVKDIISANLFGDPTPKKITIAPQPTNLDLSLDGLLWASDNYASRAIITSGKNKSALYSIGQEIIGAGGVSIKEIQQNEVILNRNGLTESLSLIKSTISGNRRSIAFNLQNSNLASSTAPDDYDTYTRFVADAQKEDNNQNH